MSTNKIKGTSGADNLAGTSDKDKIYGLDGNDSLFGGSGNDTLDGGAGDDTLLGGDGNDSLLGGADVDWLYGDAGNDRLDGGADYDYLFGGAGDDRLFGGAGDDELDGGEGNDTYVLAKGGGYDHAIFELGDVVELSGIKSKDIIISNYIGGDDESGALHSDGITISAKNGEKLNLQNFFVNNEKGLTLSNGTVISMSTVQAAALRSTDADDYIYDTFRDDVVSGGNGNDTIYSTHGFDILNGNAGNDTLEFNYSGHGQMFGGDGNDLLSAWSGADTLSGGSGNDTIRAYDGDDLLLGGEGDDDLFGSNGNDTLDGGAGNDTLGGGNGFDTFQFNRGNGLDTIEAFNYMSPLHYGFQFDASDVVLVGNSISAANVSLNIVQRVQGIATTWDLELSVNGTSDKLVIENYLTTDPSTRGSIHFIEGTTWDYATVKSMVATDVDTIAFDTLWL